MKIKSFAAVAIIAAAGLTSSFASATPLTLSPSASFSDTVAAGLFTDTWTFTLSSLSKIAGSLTNIELGSTNNISGFAANLNGVALTYKALVDDDSILQLLSSKGVFAAGDYTLTVTGIAGVGGASYGGNITALPVPEPESYAMLLAGLGLVGTIARRRSKAAQA